MREALTAVLRHGFQVMELHRIQAMVDPRNNRSQRLLERLGFAREGVLREWRFYKGQFWDEICYALLEQDAGCADVLRSQAR
jgi:ribosomal-protein-alanine N-acetyltransferase